MEKFDFDVTAKGNHGRQTKFQVGLVLGEMLLGDEKVRCWRGWAASDIRGQTFTTGDVYTLTFCTLTVK